MVRAVLSGALVGAICGFVVGGVGGRLAMRLTTMTGGFSDSSLGGTALWMTISTVLGLLLGALLGLLFHRRDPRWWTIGVLTGTLTFLSIRVEGNWDALLAAGTPWVNVVAWLVIGFGYGVCWSLLYPALRRRTRRAAAQTA